MNVAILFSYAAAFAYVVFRAFTLSLTHDEALSYIYFAMLPKSYSELITYAIPTTNNHLLNSILIKFFTTHFGNSEWIIRLPTVIGYFFFLLGAFLILKLFLSGYRFLLASSVVILHPLLIDYFSCARGYGLGLGFMMLAVYFGIKCLLNASEGDSVLRYITYSVITISFCVLSALANLIFLNTMAAQCLIILIGTWWLASERTGNHSKLSKILIAVASSSVGILVTGLVYFEPIQKLQKAKEFYYGGSSGFWADSVQSLIKATIHEKYSESPLSTVFLATLILAVCFLCSLSLIRIWRRRSHPSALELPRNVVLITAFWMIALCWLIIEIQHHLLKSVFPFDRGVIYFIPLFSMLLTVFLFSYSEPISKFTRILNQIVAIVCLLLATHYAYCFNVTHFLMNKPDAHTKEMIQYLQSENRDKMIYPQSKKFGIHWWFEPAINYYLIRYKIPWFGFVTREGFDGIYDYYYVREEDKWVLQKYNLRVLKHYDISDTYLAVPKSNAQ